MSKEQEIAFDFNLSYLCDTMTAKYAPLEEWLETSSDFNHSVGYEGQEVTLSGLVDERSINGDGRSFVTNVKARDLMRLTLDTYWQMTYYYSEPSEAPTDKFTGDPLNYTVGAKNASEVASIALQTAGLSLSWDAPDYPVVINMSGKDSLGFAGTVADTLTSLISPMQKTDMYRIDVYAIGATVYVRKRDNPETADYEIALYEDDDRLKVRDFTLTRSTADERIRKVTAYKNSQKDVGVGMNSAIGDAVVVKETVLFYRTPTLGWANEDQQGFNPVTGNGFGLLLVQESVMTLLYEDVEFGDEIVGDPEIEQTLDDYGNVSTRKVTTTIKQYPIGGDYLKLKQQHKVTKNYAHVEEFDGTDFIGISDPYLMSVETEDIYYTYNADDEIIAQDTYKRVQNYIASAGTTVTTPEQTVVNGKTVDKYSMEQTSIRYKKLTKDTYVMTTTKFVDNIKTDEQTVPCSGQLPGPRKIGKTQNSADPNGDSSAEMWYYQVDVNDNGKDIEITDDRFDEDLLADLADEVAAENLATKYVLSCQNLPMPWLRKGDRVRFTDDIPVTMMVAGEKTTETINLSSLIFVLTKSNGRLAVDQKGAVTFTGSMEFETWVQA